MPSSSGIFYGTTKAYIFPESARKAVPFVIPIGIIGIWRWGLHLLRLTFWLLYRPIKPKKNPDGSSANLYKSSDVTILVPTIDNGDELIEAAGRWLRNAPHEIIIVTSNEMKKEMERTVNSIDPTMFRVLSVPRPNKRIQLMKGIWAVKTPIVALSDDDAVWTDDFLDWMLAPFDNERMGGTGSKQEMMPVGEKVTSWEVIADFRLTMRMIEASATTFVDGGISCLSGRTAVYKTDILQDPEFERQFTDERWLGKYKLHSGDDKFITRWLVKSDRRWKMQLQNHPDCLLYTTFKPNSNFLTKQVIRWTRNTWRSDIRSIFVDRRIWCRYPYVAFNMIDKFINPLPILYGVSVIIYNVFRLGLSEAMSFVFVPIFVMILLSRILKLVPHLIQKPHHFWHVPAMIGFQYIFTLYKLYALFTLHITDWGSRANVDDAADVTDTTESHQNDHPESRQEDDDEEETIGIEESSGGDEENGPATIIKVSPEEHKHRAHKKTRIVSGIVFLLGLVAIVSLIFRFLLLLKNKLDMTEVSKVHSVSADRGTGAGVYDKSNDRTFITFSGPGMDPMVMEYDHSTKSFMGDSVTVAKAANTSDFHDYPKMVMDRDGHLVIVWTDSPDSLFMARATEPGTASAEWAVKKINDDRPTYPCLTKASNGDMYVFYRRTYYGRQTYFPPMLLFGHTYVRSDYRPLHYIKSADNGETWSTPTAAIDTGGILSNRDPTNLNEVYADCPRHEPSHDGVPERFLFGWTMSGGGFKHYSHNNYHKDAHFAYFHPATARFANAAGQDLGKTIEYDEIKSCVVFDSGPLDEDNKRIVDYYFAPSYFSGEHSEEGPIVAYNYDNKLMVSRWTGSSWSHVKVHGETAAYNLIDIEKMGDAKFRLYHSEGDIKVFANDGARSQEWELETQMESEAGRVTKAIIIHDSHPDIRLLALENEYTNWFGTNNNDIANRVWTAGTEGIINGGVGSGKRFSTVALGVTVGPIFIVVLLVGICCAGRRRDKEPSRDNGNDGNKSDGETIKDASSDDGYEAFLSYLGY